MVGEIYCIISCMGGDVDVDVDVDVFDVVVVVIVELCRVSCVWC